MRRFCEFWVDERPGLACCQFADDETLTTDPDLFNCDTCAVRDAQAQIAPENAEAWQLFHRLGTRFVVEMGLTGEAFRRLTGEWTDADAADLLERLSVIYDVLYPPRKEST